MILWTFPGHTAFVFVLLILGLITKLYSEKLPVRLLASSFLHKISNDHIHATQTLGQLWLLHKGANLFTAFILVF